MDSNVSLYEDTLKFYLVQVGDGASEEIRFAREKLSENVGEHNIISTNSRECGRFMENVTKKDVFVLSEFSDNVFDKLCQTEALVVGPQCVITCFMDNESVPNNKSPVFTMAMRNLIVSLSAFTLAEKRELKKLIGFMGGRCIDQFTENVTHLVTDKVISTKYEQAAIQGKIIMKSDWVKDVWAKSARENILATHQMFDRHRVPVFYNLAMTTTGLKEKVKLDVKRLIEENGGQYFGEFSANKIKILILDLKPKESPKWKAAISSHKDCLTYKWIFESVKAKFALPLDRYRVELVSKPIASTPERQLRSSNGAPNFDCTDMSMVSNVSYANTVNETIASQMSVESAASRKSPDVGEKTSPLYRITLQDAKRAGLFLDGCNIYACGFAPEEKEKIWKILNSGGATRFDTINSSLSHILVGNPTKAEVVMLQAVKNDAYMLKLDWLVESIAKKGAITDYERFLYRLSGPGKSAETGDESSSVPSPASKRNILSMAGNSMKQPNPRRLNFQSNAIEPNKAQNTSIASELSRTDVPINENMENLILDQYLNASVNKDKSMFKAPAPVAPAMKGVPEPAKTNYVPMNPSEESIEFDDSSAMSSTETDYNFLANKMVFIHGFDEESHAALVYNCELGGATIITDNNYKQMVDYMILSIDILSMDGITVKARNIVNHHWLLNAKKLNKPIDIPYYYKPIFFSEDLKPLAGLIIVFSTYAADERTFLAQLAEILGAEVQDSYRKVARPLLICPTVDNKKYDAAIKWNLPVVTCDWLLACYKYAQRLPVKNFLVGDSISPVDDVPDIEMEPESVAELDPIRIDVEDVPKRMPNAGETPVNPRVHSLRTPVGNQRARDSSHTPAAAHNNDNDDLLNSFNTPEQDNVQRMLNASTSDTETPETKRARWERWVDGDRSTPEYARTPYLLEQRRQFLEQRLNRYKPTESEKNKKKSTPWTEYKRRFWKETLGDAYESPSQCYTANTQAFTQVNATVASSSRRLVYNTSVATADLEADANIRKFDAFIKNRDNAADVPEAIPDSAPRMHEMDLPNTELPEIIGWGDPDERRSNNVMRFRGTPYFSVSLSNNESAKIQILEQIRQLNGRICENLQSFDKMCSHLLCERPNRGEKTCCCIASGKWVLSTEYIQKSIQAGRFLDEELYEWGNPKAAKNLPTLTEQEEPFAKAAYRFRVRMETTGTGVFKDMCAIVRTNKDENMRNLIEAGHGKVLNDNKSKPLSAQKDLLAAATHLIVQPKFAHLAPDDIKAIKKTNIICVIVNYLNACITTDSERLPLDPKPYLIKL